ncbi:MAG: hypothetical protein AW09_003753 [Candidatus Accumulibacter phosphatis]|uniref:Uncharacterized protein n=1 Tax=Candidatus Accumulibacter phosphatis TaxID=327160 RepID=A0A080LS24_9PROT|nr:MAG: hypothetical protein AW09_003753 [Candidatus Accumulibacter phosphatis]
MFPNQASRFLVAELIDTLEVIHGGNHPPAHFRAILRAPAIRVDLEFLSVMRFEHLHHQHRDRMQAEIRGAIADADFPVSVAARLGEGWQILEYLLVRVASRGGQLYRRIIGHRKHGQGGGGILHQFRADLAGASINWPTALFHAQKYPVVEYIRLGGIDRQTPVEIVRGIPIFFFDLQHPAKIVQGKQQEGLVFIRVGGNIALNPQPLFDRLVQQAPALKDQPKVESRLNEARRQGDRLPVSLFRSRQIPEIRQRRAEVEVRRMGVG